MKFGVERYNLFEKFEEVELNENNALGRVTEVHKGMYKVISQHGERRAVLKSGIFYNYNVSFPAVGDFVVINYNPNGEDTIIKVLNRFSLFSRLDSFNKTQQVVASNFDYVLILTSLNKEFNLKRLDRYILSAWESGGVPVIVLTKTDICEDITYYINAIKEVAFGVEIFPVSSHTMEGVEDLRSYLKEDATIVLLGSSGVGKSSLVNALAGKQVMRVNEIREDDAKGKHTTTHRQMIFLESGLMVIDTPGMRELELWKADSGLERAFEDIDNLSKHCRFKDCSHDKEPGCAVKEALESGELSYERWNSFQKLRKETRYAESKADNKLRLEEKAKWKAINKEQKLLYKNK